MEGDLFQDVNLIRDIRNDFAHELYLDENEIEKIDSKLKVELDFVAVRYTKYFCDMYYKFKLRQSHNPADVNIHQFFNESKKQHVFVCQDCKKGNCKK